MIRVTRTFRFVPVALAVFGVAFAFGFMRSASLVQVPPDYKHAGGEEWLVVFIGSSACASAGDTTVANAVRSIVRFTAQHAAQDGIGMSTLGIATNWNPREGFEYLSAITRFDEFAVGRNWANAGVLKYVWQHHPGEPITPQLLVVARTVNVPTAPGERFGIGNERVIVRLTGSAAIRGWESQAFLTARGAPSDAERAGHGGPTR